MPSLSGNYNPAVGILVQVTIFPSSLLPGIGVAGGNPPAMSNQSLTMFSALVDTGASITCISTLVVQHLGLVPSGRTTMAGSTGQSPVDQYTFGVGFLFNPQQNPSGTFNGNLNAHLVQGCEFVNHGFGFDVLLGRDILCLGVLNMSFDGHYLLSF